MERVTLTAVQKLRLRAEPVLEAPATIMVPAGSELELRSGQAPGWIQILAGHDDRPSVGWCMRQMLDAALHDRRPLFEAAEELMWALVRQFTGRTGYQRGVKGPGLQGDPQ